MKLVLCMEYPGRKIMHILTFPSKNWAKVHIIPRKMWYVFSEFFFP